MPKGSVDQIKPNRVMALMQKIAYASNRSKCSCEICLLGRALAEELEGQIDAEIKKGSKPVVLPEVK
jgi:hypothetical protein